jgi:hypothetical protein
MSKFQKAAPQQARLKISVYGPPGSGKTFTTLLMAEGLAKVRGKRIAYVDTERGTDFYAMNVKDRKVHPAAFDFDAIYTRSIAEIDREIRALKPEDHSVIVLDSMSHIWDAAMDAYKGAKTSIGSIPMHAWGKIKKPYKDLLAFLIASPFDVFILGRQKNVFEDDENGEMKKSGVAMRAEGETAYEPHICMRMEFRQHAKDTTKGDNVALVEKDRTGVLSGRTIVNPDFTTIQPLLPLLGETQAPNEDEEERIAKDSELLAKQEDKSKAKEGKSITLFNEYQPKLMTAPTLSDLAFIASELKKAKRYLTEEHVAALVMIHNSRRDALVSAEAPSL